MSESARNQEVAVGSQSVVVDQSGMQRLRLRVGYGYDGGRAAANFPDLRAVRHAPDRHLGDSTPGAVIYVTTDGTMPTLSSLIYQGPFSLTQAGAVKVQAVAFAGGYSTSSVAVANFTLQ